MTIPVIRWQGESADPYAEFIASFMGREFPQLSSRRTEDIIDAVVDEFFSTKQFRLGPKPHVESEVLIRDVARKAIEVGSPIPILIPSAAVKVPIGESLDLAELSALRILGCLQQRIKQHYDPGVTVRVRLEDLTEYAISGTTPDIMQLVDTYSTQYTALVKALDYDSFITPIRESEMADFDDFMCNVGSAADLFFDYSIAKHGGAGTAEAKVADQLSALGWKGGVSWAMYEFMADRYAKLYPDLDFEARQRILARYFAAILVRKRLNATGKFDYLPQWELSFATPLPDAPRISTRVIYRSVPLYHSSNNTAYWNAKGHLRITEQNTARIAFGDWDAEYTKGQLTIENNDAKVTIRADYVLE